MDMGYILMTYYMKIIQKMIFHMDMDHTLITFSMQIIPKMTSHMLDSGIPSILKIKESMDI
jgi:hypothetical protein